MKDSLWWFRAEKDFRPYRVLKLTASILPSWPLFRSRRVFL